MPIHHVSKEVGMSLADLTVGDFEPRSGDVFRLHAYGLELELKLAEVTRLGRAPGARVGRSRCCSCRRPGRSCGRRYIPLRIRQWARWTCSLFHWVREMAATP